MSIYSWYQFWYTNIRKEVKAMKDFEEKIKELIELVGQLEKLMIRIISLTGWVIILIKIIS